MYKHANKCIQMRGSNGRFRHTTLADFGFEEAKRPRICNQCDREFRPVVVTGICPGCGAEDSSPKPPTDEERDRLAAYRAKCEPHPFESLSELAREERWLRDRGLI